LESSDGFLRLLADEDDEDDEGKVPTRVGTLEVGTLGFVP
jgi:hypothetical protein